MRYKFNTLEKPNKYNRELQGESGVVGGGSEVSSTERGGSGADNLTSPGS